YGIRAHDITEIVAIASHFSIDENHHMLSNFTLLVEHIAARFFVVAKVVGEDGSQSRTGRLARWALHMTLDVSCESYCRHRYTYPYITASHPVCATVLLRLCFVLMHQGLAPVPVFLSRLGSSLPEVSSLVCL